VIPGEKLSGWWLCPAADAAYVLAVLFTKLPE